VLHAAGAGGGATMPKFLIIPNGSWRLLARQ
jgi:hypothetical protein